MKLFQWRDDRSHLWEGVRRKHPGLAPSSQSDLLIISPWSKPYRKQPARVFWSTEQSLKGGGWIWEVEGKREKPVHLPRSHRPCLRRYRSNKQISKEQVIQLGKKKGYLLTWVGLNEFFFLCKQVNDPWLANTREPWNETGILIRTPFHTRKDVCGT